MKYFKADKDATSIIKLSDERTVEINSRVTYQEDVESIVAQFELLRKFEGPIYTEERLKHFFPELEEVSEGDYFSLLKDIDQYNKEVEAINAEINALQIVDLQRYISQFPVATNNLLSFGKVRKLVSVFQNMREVEEASANFSADGQSEDFEDDIKEVYSILRHVEKTKDTSVVDGLLDLVGDELG